MSVNKQNGGHCNAGWRVRITGGIPEHVKEEKQRNKILLWQVEPCSSALDLSSQGSHQRIEKLPRSQTAPAVMLSKRYGDTNYGTNYEDDCTLGLYQMWY
eukprot:2308204-Rhodomonas_salina.2